MMARPVTNLKDRFTDKISFDSVTDCWLWQGSLTKDGYGRFRLGQKGLGAHRMAYLLYRGPIPAGFEPDHLCRVTRCVNPDHLELVTHRVNVQRGYAARARLREKLRSPEHREELRLKKLMERVQAHLRKEKEKYQIAQPVSTIRAQKGTFSRKSELDF